MFYYIPSNVNLEPHLSEIGSKIHLEKYYYFISLLTEIKAKNRSYSEDDFVKLKSVFLRNIITSRKQNDVINNLEKWNFIEKNNSYRVSSYSKSYKLTEKYKNQPLIKIKTSDKILARINRHSYTSLHHLELKEKMENMFKKGHFFVNQFSKEKIKNFKELEDYVHNIEIDYEAAKTYLKSLKNISQQKFNILLITLDKIYEKDFYFIIDHKSNRIFTNITSIFKQFRQFLRYKNQKLKNIDISNSQPLFFSLFLYKKRQHKDITLYNNLVSTGKFYKYLYESFQKEYKTKLIFSDFKKLFFKRVFFCNSYHNFKYKESKIFEKLFPNVFKTIVEYKRKLGYKQFIFLLQKIESKIIVKNIACKLAKDMPIWTIHDSIMTTEKNIEKARKFILKILFLYKINVKLKIK